MRKRQEERGRTAEEHSTLGGEGGFSDSQYCPLFSFSKKTAAKARSATSNGSFLFP